MVFEDRPGGDIVYPLETAADLEKMKKTPFLLKEGCHYKIKVTFRVQHDIVSGLKYVNAVYRKGIRGMFILLIVFVIVIMVMWARRPITEVLVISAQEIPNMTNDQYMFIIILL